MKRIASLAVVGVVGLSSGCGAKPPPKPVASEIDEFPAKGETDHESVSFECLVDKARSQTAYSREFRLEWTKWFKEAWPMLDQFEFTPWNEIPAKAHDPLRSRWAHFLQKTKAQRAIEQQAPVSAVTLTCKDGTAHCFELERPENQEELGGFYGYMVRRQLLSFMEELENMGGSAILDARIDEDNVRRGTHKLTLLNAMQEEIKVRQAALRELGEFYSMLPASAVLPEVPEIPETGTPTSCVQ